MSAKFASNPACAPIIPIYPVRYAYINIFDDLVPADNPPDVAAMMNRREASETKGYAIRLLREGWVYIREEDSNQLLHIFKYTQKQNGKSVTESFEKYLFKNKTNALDGLTLDNSVKQLPFAFVSANTSKISIVYTEHELSPNLIDKIHSNQDVRTRSMQLIDLIPEQSNHSIVASADNLKSLVEDYRDLPERMLTELKQENDKHQQVDLDVFTNQPSYEQTSEKIIEQLEKELYSQERARIVTLFDPVGRQLDIALALTMLFVLEKSVEAGDMYPKTIGDYILQLNKTAKGRRTSSSEQLQAAIHENINIVELNKFYKESREMNRTMKERRTGYLDLFSSFAYQDLADGSVGSLDVFLDMFFDSESPKESFKEIQKLNAVMSSMFDGIEGTKEGQDVVVSMINAAYEEGTNNVYLTFEGKVATILLHCQDHVVWGELSTEMVANTPKVLKFLWSWTAAIAKYGKDESIKSALKLRSVAYAGLLDFIPLVFEKGFGIKEQGGSVRMTLDQLGIELAKNIDSMGKNHFQFAKAETALKYGKNLVNWANGEKATTLPEFEQAANNSALPKLTVPNYGSRYTNFDADSNIALLGKSVDGAISILSFRANIDVLFQLTQISEFDRANPTSSNGWAKPTQGIAIAIAALSGAVVDGAGAQRAEMLLAKKMLNSTNFYFAVKSGLPSLLGVMVRGGTNSLTSKIDSRLNHLESLSKAKVFTKLIAAANLALLVSSAVEAKDAYETGNTGLMYAHINSMISYSMFAAGPILAMRNISSATINSGYFALIGFVLLLVAEGMKLKYRKTELENLLFSCFWGSSEKYPFWSFERAGDFNISKRLDFASKRYTEDKFQLALQIEQQEFMNLLLRPELRVWVKKELSATRKVYGYRITLPGFTFGESNIVGAMCSKKWQPIDIMQPVHKMRNRKIVENMPATEAFSQALNNAINSNDFFKREFIDGTLNLNFEVEMESEHGEELNLHWYYQQSADVIVPKRMRTSDGVLEKTYYGMVDDKPSSI